VDVRDAKSALELLRELGIEIEGTPIWEVALTHRSYAHEAGGELEHNERLEFLGDAVIELAVSEYLYARFPKSAEGELARMRASVVRAESLANAARELALGALMKLGNGEEQAGGRDRTSLLADLFEAVTGAVFLSSGWSAARAFVLAALGKALSALKDPRSVLDPKSVLQERLQAESKAAPTYRLVRKWGPDHCKVFVSEVVHMGRALATGVGPSKKASEQAAAEEALRALGMDPRS